MDRLFFKYLAPLLAISILPTLAITLILFFFIRNNISELENNLITQDTETITKIVSEKNEAIARKEGMFIEHEVDKVREKLKAMQLNPDFIRLDVENISAYSENLFAQESSIMELTVTNNHGDMVYQKFNSVSLETDEPFNVRKETVFREVERKINYTSPVEISTATQLPFITLGHPILRSSGALAGAVIVKLDLEFIGTLVSSKRVGESGILYIISQKGKLISHPSAREFYQNADYAKYEYINEILKKKNGTVWNEGNLASFYTNKYGWTTIIELPSKEALQAVESNRRMILGFINATLDSIAYFTVLIIIFGFVIAIVATIFITKRVITPILNFTNATRRISQGEFSMKIEKQSNDELGELTDSFNKMAEELKKEREELLRSNELVRRQAQEIISRNLADSETQGGMNFSEFEKPLVRVKNYLSEVKKTGASKAEVTGEVLSDIEQIDHFLKDLFENSRITANTADFTPVDFFDSFKGALEKLQKEVMESNADIRCGSMPVTKALRSSIVQLFENLISNAIKYRSDKPLEIIVSSEEKTTEWLFVVKDNGIGIEPDALADIFHVREQRDNGHFRFSFGLALCKNIVERHGGKIWAESHRGEGSKFFFTIKKY